MTTLTFFTDITTNISKYCLLNIKQFDDIRKSYKKIIYIDPSVYELTKSNEYSNIEKLHILSSGNLQPNEFISIDYPSDMNLQYTDEFIEKSYQNNLKYKNNSQYICTIQSIFQNIDSFITQYNKHAPIFENQDKILGIGNLCRIMHPNEFTDKVFDFLLSNQYKIKSIHFYGLALKLIKKYLSKFSIPISVDSTKWTRAVTNDFKLAHGVCAKKHNRDLYFLEYIKQLQPFFNNIFF